MVVYFIYVFVFYVLSVLLEDFYEWEYLVNFCIFEVYNKIVKGNVDIIFVV